MTNLETIILYLSIIVVSSIISLHAQKTYVNNDGFFYTKINKFLYVIVFIILWFFVAFTDIGADRLEYIRIASYAKFSTLFYCEFGLNLVFILFKWICFGNIEVTLFCTTTLALFVFFVAFWKMRKQANLSVMIFSFGILLYLRFYLMSMFMASALIFLGLAYLLGENKKFKALICYLLSCTMHYSAILISPCVLLISLNYVYKRKKISTIKIIIISFLYVVCLMSVSTIYNFLVNNIDIFSAYKMYSIINNNSLGLGNYILFIPIFWFVYRAFKKIENTDFVNIFFIISITGFLIALLGYKIEVVSRMNYFFYVIHILLMPMYISLRKNGDTRICQIKKMKLYEIVWMLYVLLYGMMVFWGIVNSETTSGVSVWNFYFPFNK